MKLRSISILAALLILTLSMAMAWPKIHKTVYVAEPTVVGGVEVEPGTRNIHHRLERNRPQLSSQFLAPGKTIATAPATLVPAKNRYDSLTTSQTQDGKKSLVEIRLTNSTLDFVQGDARSGN
jgi:hypothetical protein